MKINRISLIVFFLMAHSLYIGAQIQYPIVGRYKDRSAQGMAIYGHYAYLFNDGGLCRKLNLKTGYVDGEFMIESAAKNTHVNNACFSRQYIAGNTVPVLYITEFYGTRRCFVEAVNENNSKLIQTIEYTDSLEHHPFVRGWIVDNDKNVLYAVIRDKNRSQNNFIKKFRLPSLGEGSYIRLTEKDVLDEFSVSFVNGLQGGKIVGQKMYLVTGFSELNGLDDYNSREIKVIDLKRKVLINRISL